ncbi:MAG TPA: hypothetical protein VEC99_09220, partial [Clostridia bacterium]|nr:hypothetical protein [Clostridia bacterium]
WAVVSGVGLVLMVLHRQFGLVSFLTMPLLALAAVTAITWVAFKHQRAKANWHELARQIEKRYPELDSRLLTALQQSPGEDGKFSFLQTRLFQEVLRHSSQADWAQAAPKPKLALAEVAHWGALGLFLFILFGLRTPTQTPLLSARFDWSINVTPGDTELERGSALVVMARFGRSLPATVDLVIGQPPAVTRTPLVKSLGDPMFGGSVSEVASNFVYRIEYNGQQTREYKVKVFEYPRLERADVEVTYPEYTAQAPKRIENTRRLSAVEGSHVDLELKFNKPVVSARLVPKEKGQKTLSLMVDSNSPAASLKQLSLESTRTYDLQLTDFEGRTNKVPAQFVFEVLANRPPEIRLARPRGDLRPSPLEEIPFEGTVWDDFGVQAYGLGYVIAGQEPRTIELGRAVGPKDKRPFEHLLRLEDLAVQPDQLISWFVWAEDLGADGKIRRTTGDLFFGEVRPFDEVFREGQGMEGGGQGDSGGESGGQNRTSRLTELQKQIISATWKIQRERETATGRQPALEGKTPATSGPQSRNSQSPGVGFRERDSFPVVKVPARVVRVAGQVAPNSAPTQADGPRRRTRNSERMESGSNRNSSGGAQDDMAVVHESQAQALEEARAALEQQRDPRAAALWRAAIKDMENAVARLQQATNSPNALKEALASEQAAYQALLKLQEHEYQVNRSRNRNQRGGSRDQQMQRQLDELDMGQTENRYETQREAQRPQSTERREQLQVMNRLQELARRQQDLNDRLKEMQTALQEARTEEERAEIQRRLKRLQEEEQQMLNDLDELRQRMERPENQSRMAEERRQLDQTREDVQRAAEAASQ